MDVCVCSDGIFPHAVGGIQRHTRLLVEALAEYSDLRIRVLHPHSGVEIFDTFSNVQEIYVPPRPKKKQYLLECYDYSKNVLKILQQHPRSLIYSQGLAVWAGIEKVSDRLIINPHGLEAYQAIGVKNKLISIPFRIVGNHIMKHARYIVSLGGRLTDILERHFGREKVIVLPNAVNVPPKPEPKPFSLPLRCVFVGRFSFNKGIHILLEAAKVLNKRGFEDSFVFDLIGTGPLLEKFRTMYSLDNVNFLGSVSDERLASSYRESAVLILPTLFEGMPTVVLEAMSHGTPIIVTDVGATRELVDAKNGFIIKKGSVSSLVETLLTFYRMSIEDKKNLAFHSRLKIEERFTWEAVAKEHRILFQRMS